MRALKCPKCRETMIVVEYGDVETDTCAACGGVWLDGGELEALAGLALPPGERADSSLGAPDVDCPICVSKLLKGRYGRTDVVVDKCPHGDGIWLDAGELGQILAAYRGSAEEPKDHEAHGAGALAQLFGAGRSKPQEDRG